MATLAIDFDGTIHDMSRVPEGKRLGPPMPGAVEGMRELNAQGHNLCIFTVRGDQKYVHDWLKYFGIPYHLITNTKQGFFDCFFDDRGFPHFSDPAKAWAAFVRHVNPYHGGN